MKIFLKKKNIIIAVLFTLLIAYIYEFGVAPPKLFCYLLYDPRAYLRLRSFNKDINFFGRVIDDKNSPVPGANVQFQIMYSGRFILGSSVTDEKGDFKVIKKKGRSLDIEKIYKKGYEYQPERNENSFNYGTYLERDAFKPDPSNPVIFHMRKKEPPTLVLKCGFNWIEKMNDLVTNMDFSECHISDGKSAHADLEVVRKRSDDGSGFRFLISTPHEDSGIVISDELSYVPPETGYKRSVEITVPVPEKGIEYKKILYVKSRGGMFYSRLNTSFRVGRRGDKNESAISMHSLTNPNGIRNVDFDEDLFAQYLKDKEAQKQKRRDEYDREMKKKERGSKSFLWRLFH